MGYAAFPASSECQRIWPDEWDVPVQRDDIAVQRVSLEDHKLPEAPAELEPVSGKATWRKADIKELPVQVVELQSKPEPRRNRPRT